ncbi:hypothetical protein ACFPFV_12980 [Salinicoccus siamensis]|uniref:hypothetical protein n=1 Tax=Salinicoccus siamensis TaxID=381830 RepID=UPI0036188A1F
MMKAMIPQYDKLERNEQEEVEHQFNHLIRMKSRKCLRRSTKSDTSGYGKHH